METVTADDLTRQARRPYRLLKGRGDDDAAAELASLPAHEQRRYVDREFVDFDPEHDDPVNQELLKVRHAYDALRALGFDDRADALRGVVNSGTQLDRAREALDEVGAEVDLVTGEIANDDGGEGE